MAHPQAMSKFATIVTFIAFSATLTSEGRPIISAREDKLRAIDNNQMHEQALQLLTPSQSPANDDHSDAGKEKVPSTTAHDQAADLGKSEAVYEDDFRPTPPGSSPGVGHISVGPKKGGVQPNARSSDEEMLTVTETPGEIRPNGTGPSAGVGH